MIAALYVHRNGPYYGIPDVDPWDEKRDARKYPGPHPVVAHPPCTRWCQLAHIIQKRYGHRVGDDGGCFEAALAAVRRWGGVLEHPAKTIAWTRFKLPMPRRGRWVPAANGWTTEVFQGAYGHRALKATWLFVVGAEPPPLKWDKPIPTAIVGHCKNHGKSTLPRLSKREASATPIEFRDLLLNMARAVE